MNLNHYPIEKVEIGAGFKVPCTPQNANKKKREVEVDLISAEKNGMKFLVWTDFEEKNVVVKRIA